MRVFSVHDVVEYGAIGLVVLLSLGSVLNMVLNSPGSTEREFTAKIFRVEVNRYSTEVFTYGMGFYYFDGDLSNVIKEGFTYRFRINRGSTSELLELEEIYN